MLTSSPTYDTDPQLLCTGYAPFQARLFWLSHNVDQGPKQERLSWPTDTSGPSLPGRGCIGSCATPDVIAQACYGIPSSTPASSLLPLPKRCKVRVCKRSLRSTADVPSPAASATRELHSQDSNRCREQLIQPSNRHVLGHVAGRRLLQEQHRSRAFLHIYSALHDPVAGAIRVFADAYPDPQCTDIKSCHVAGEEAWPRMAARAEVPFPRLRDPTEPEPMECIITCQLPPGHEQTILGHLTLRDAEGADRAAVKVERIQALEKKRGWGLCVGPVFSDVPQFEVCIQPRAGLLLAFPCLPSYLLACMHDCPASFMQGNKGPAEACGDWGPVEACRKAGFC